MKDLHYGRRRILKWAGGLGLLGTLWLPRLASAENPPPTEKSLVGTWLITITYASDADNTRGMATFTGDGCFIGSVTAYEETPVKPTPSRGTTLHGSWLRTDYRDYAVTAYRLHMEADGTMLGTMKTQIVLTLDKSLDAWSGTFSFDAISPAGETLRTDNGTLEASRVVVDLT